MVVGPVPLCDPTRPGDTGTPTVPAGPRPGAVGDAAPHRHPLSGIIVAALPLRGQVTVGYAS